MCKSKTSEGEVIIIFFEGEARTILGVELGEPSSMFEYELIFLNQQWLDFVALVIPGYHVSFQLRKK